MSNPLVGLLIVLGSMGSFLALIHWRGLRQVTLAHLKRKLAVVLLASADAEEARTEYYRKRKAALTAHYLAPLVESE